MYMVSKLENVTHFLHLERVPFQYGVALYRVSQKKRNGGYLFTALNQISSAEEIGTKIIKFGWVVLILLSIS